jgi:hypothetical protein
MIGGRSTTTADEARRMLDAFASVGARAVDVTWTNSDGDKLQFRRDVALADLARRMPGILYNAGRQQSNIIVRPHGPGIMFLQLDDLAGDMRARVAAVAFLVIETSLGNYQACLALPSSHSKDFVRRVKKGTEADTGASGATRIAGSFNYKPEHAPDYPLVLIRSAQPSRKTSAAELEELGLVAPPEKFAPLPPALSTSPRRWPLYSKALDGAPLNSEGTGPDRSRADYVWSMTAISWGFEIEETATQLMRHSEKAHNDPAYARLTVIKAAEAVERRRPAHRLAEYSRR